MAIICRCCAAQRRISYEETGMNGEFSAIARRLDELEERLARLEPIQSRV
jgi:hypothetical protein